MNTKFSYKGAVIASVASLALVLSGCAGERGSSNGEGGGGDGEEAQTLTLGHGAAPGNPRTIAAETFQDLVESGTDGAVQIQIMGQETIGSDPEMLNSVQGGSLDMTINSQGPFASFVPEMNLVGLPFLFENSEHAYSVLDGQTLDHVSEAAEEHGFVVLGYWDNGMRDVTNSSTAIESPSDVQGLSIRTPDDQMTMSIFESLGANPTPMDFGELYMALNQGAVDGQENPVVNIKSNNLDEVQEHLAVTGHKYETNPFVISDSVWESLSQEHQEVIQDAADEAQTEQRELMAEQTTEILEEFEESLAVTYPDREEFREATADVYDDWESDYTDFFEALTTAAEDSREEFSGDGS